MQHKEHWEQVYCTKSSDSVSWYQEHAIESLRLIEASGVPNSASIIDVGGGASTLVDDLLATGHDHLTVLDLSGAALRTARARLGSRSDSVIWLEAEVTKADLPPVAYDVWHDRAVFHFLVNAEDRRAYVACVLRSVKPGGHVIIATFAEDGPLRCSGLPVMRYGGRELHAEFGDAFEIVSLCRAMHETPSGMSQSFTYCHFLKEPQA